MVPARRLFGLMAAGAAALALVLTSCSSAVDDMTSTIRSAAEGASDLKDASGDLSTALDDLDDAISGSDAGDTGGAGDAGAREPAGSDGVPADLAAIEGQGTSELCPTLSALGPAVVMSTMGVVGMVSVPDADVTQEQIADMRQQLANPFEAIEELQGVPQPITDRIATIRGHVDEMGRALDRGDDLGGMAALDGDTPLMVSLDDYKEAIEVYCLAGQ